MTKKPAYKSLIMLYHDKTEMHKLRSMEFAIRSFKKEIQNLCRLKGNTTESKISDIII